MTTHASALRPGDLVEVKTSDEILATLDADGALDGLPFMPEMVALCGKRFRVSQRVGRMCVSGPQVYGTMREFTTSDVVVLDDVRCSGAAHGDCQRACVIFWREAWLQRVSPGSVPPTAPSGASERLHRHLKTRSGPDAYFCQASQLFKMTHTLGRREQVVRCVSEVRAGDCGMLEMARRLGTWLFWRIRRKLFGEYARGPHTSTPTAALDLRPGEWVEVKPLESILTTLDGRGYNRGLYFSPDMRLACGRRFQVKERIDRIIEDGTGKMRHLRHTVRLAHSLCACPYINIGGCTRADIVYWREIWLRRVEAPVEPPRRAERRAAPEPACPDRREVAAPS